ncbi:MAG: DUF6508 domain-containing protein [Bacteroidota bacterium]
MALQGISDNSLQVILAFRSRFALHTNFAANQLPVVQEVQNLQNDFTNALDQHGFTQVFDWNEWAAGLLANINDPVLLASADFDTLCKIVTAHIRTDRFVRGHLQNLISTGYFILFLNRLEVLNAG